MRFPPVGCGKMELLFSGAAGCTLGAEGAAAAFCAGLLEDFFGFASWGGAAFCLRGCACCGAAGRCPRFRRSSDFGTGVVFCIGYG